LGQALGLNPVYKAVHIIPKPIPFGAIAVTESSGCEICELK